MDGRNISPLAGSAPILSLSTPKPASRAFRNLLHGRRGSFAKLTFISLPEAGKSRYCLHSQVLPLCRLPPVYISISFTGREKYVSPRVSTVDICVGEYTYRPVR